MRSFNPTPRLSQRLINLSSEELSLAWAYLNATLAGENPPIPKSLAGLTVLDWQMAHELMDLCMEQKRSELHH